MSSSVAATSHTQQPHAVQERAVLFRWTLPLLGVFSLLASCVISSSRRQLSGDEVFTHLEIGDPSLLHLFRAVPHLGGGGMPLFYLTAWNWEHLCGASDLSLRFYSSVAVCAAFLLLLTILRRRCGDRAAFLGVAFGLFSSLMVVEQNAEARAYGLYLLLFVVAIRQWLRIAETQRPAARDLALLFLTQAGLVLGHVLGLIYAGLLLLALIAVDAGQRRFRPRVYLCCMAGWLALVPWVPAILASMAVGRPHGWIPMPGFGSFIAGLSCWLFTGLYWPALRNLPLGLGAAWLCGFTCVAGLVAAAVAALRIGPSSRRPMLLLGLTLVLAPIFFFLLSKVAQPVFLPRYMIPSAAGVAILCACWAQESTIGKGSGGGNLGMVLVALPMVTAALLRPDLLNVARVDQIAAGRPVVCDYNRDFNVLWRYTTHPTRVQYVLDWPAALRGPRASVTDFHLMQNYRRAGYLAGNVRDVSEVLHRPSFLLLDNSETNWFHLEIENDPRFSWKTLDQLDDQRRIVEVDRNP
jgi:hypothetical protein